MTPHRAMGWTQGDPGLQPPLSVEERAIVFEQAVAAVGCLFGDFGLIHRDFRTANLMIVGRGGGTNGMVRVIDLGHTIAAEEPLRSNRSAVVRCGWRETKGKRFDWAPMEVKEGP